MKIAFLINVFREDDFHSGGEKVFYELITRSITEGHRVDLYCSKYLSASGQQTLGINKVVILGQSYFYKDPEKVEVLYEEFKAIIDKEDYDFVLAENITPVIDMSFVQGHSVIHCRNRMNSFLSRIFYSIKNLKQLKYQKRWMEQDFRKILAPSNTLKEDIMLNFGVSEDKFAVIYPGVDVPENVQETNYDELKNRDIIFGISAPSFTNKGGYIFLKALHIMKNRGYKFKTKAIYSKARKNLAVISLVKLYGLDDYIEFLSHQEDMQEFYRSVDVVVIPSVLESFGLVVLEAMANKKTCIVSSWTGASELIEEGVNGFIFDMSRNPAENLAQKMISLIEGRDNLKEVVKNSYKTAQKYSWEYMYGDFMKKISIR